MQHLGLAPFDLMMFGRDLHGNLGIAGTNA